MATYVVADIHGEYDKLLELLNIIKFMIIIFYIVDEIAVCVKMNAGVFIVSSWMKNICVVHNVGGD